MFSGFVVKNRKNLCLTRRDNRLFCLQLGDYAGDHKESASIQVRFVSANLLV